MRQKQRIQPTIQEPWLDHEHAKELQAISCLLDDHPNVSEMILQDLVAASGAETPQGAWGLTADQVLRCLILKQMTGFSYRDLEYHLGDSLTYRRFCELGFVDKPPSKSALQAAIKAIRPETLEKINLELTTSPEILRFVSSPFCENRVEIFAGEDRGGTTAQPARRDASRTLEVRRVDPGRLTQAAPDRRRLGP